MTPHDPLAAFLPPVQAWFRAALGEPTPAQRHGWPSIVAGQHSLILAPTGSGKTLAAFLGCLDGLWRLQPLPRGVRVLYVSPLKALNNDIYRNLQVPLSGVAETARSMGFVLPDIEIAVRTGDTPAAERQRLLRRPPHVLITTPESLHLLLTSKARETLRGVTHCIVDEIHSLCPNKRGVFLALLLERLQTLNPAGFVRIGLSATQRPLEEVARYLGGLELVDGEARYRPVTIVDAGLRKDLDLRVVSPVDQFGPLVEKSIWPSLYRLLSEEINRHRSTIIFANNRRSVERITANLNEAVGSRQEAVGSSGQTEEVLPGSDRLMPTDDCLLPSANCLLTTDFVRAHHGSVALEVRQETERALKEGRLRAVVATASLELGIDMGAVDLVCQVESPGSVARGLQRVGRAGHLVGQTSKGRLIPKTLPDLLEQAVLAAEMAAGRVEALRVPMNCLDVLAQQIVAMTSMDEWEVAELFALVRRAYPYRDLSAQAFETVLEMVSGRYRFPAPVADGEDARPAHVGTLAALQPRISWDRIHNRLRPLPGSQRLALVNGGTIPDTGQYGVYAGTNVRIGELDEEFIHESRLGDTFLLGTNAWRLEQIDADRVFVVPAEGAPAKAPFWRGEQAGRSYDLGLALGKFLGKLKNRLGDADCQSWLEKEHFLDPAAARNLRSYVRRQLERTGCLPTDRTIVVEASRDQLGDWQVIVLCPLGSRFNLGLRLALENVLRRRLGYSPQCLHQDDGILIRLADADEPVMDVFEGLTAENVKDLILDELADSALFALRFRQSAARALLLPRMGAGKRAPLWLQRLRGRDLLQVARRQPDFPIVAETFRECLHDHLDVPRLEKFLADVKAREIEVVTRRQETPSPFAAALLFAFTAEYMYEFDATQSEPSPIISLDRHLLDQLAGLDDAGRPLDARAIHQVERRLRGLGQPPRSATEMAEWLRRLGDLTAGELEGPMAGFLQELDADGRARRFTLPAGREPARWILAEEEERYRQAFGSASGPNRNSEGNPAQRQRAAEAILYRFLETHTLVGLQDVLDRYPFESAWARRKLEEWAQSGRLVTVRRAEAEESVRWSAPANLEQVQRTTLSLLRREIITCPPQQFADFVLHWQAVHPEARRGNAEGLVEVLHRLQALHLPAELWEQTILPSRVPGYQPGWLDEALASGDWVWACRGDGDTGPGPLAFLERETLGRLAPPTGPESAQLDSHTEQVFELLRTRGALFVTELASLTGRDPSRVRQSLWQLVRLGLVTNDQFSAIRRGEDQAERTEERETRREERGVPRQGRGRSTRFRPSRSSLLSRRPEGRWSLLPWERPDVETQAFFQASILLERYGVVARELALMDSAMLPWRVLYEILSRLELAGTLRRGYFVEGLSGAQFALPEAARLLQDLTAPSTAAASLVLLHSLDPANMHGSGAPFDIPLLDEGTRPFVRRPGNWLVVKAGRPVLLIEGQGKRLTALPSASREDIAAAVACLPAILDLDRGRDLRRRLTVEEWNGQPVTGTEGREMLEAGGFVRDYQSMTLYAVWR